MKKDESASELQGFFSDVVLGMEPTVMPAITETISSSFARQQGYLSYVVPEGYSQKRAQRERVFNPDGLWRFIEDKFDTHLTDDMRRVCRSVMMNTRTIVRSANSTGKTHAAGRIALAWYKIFPASQVWTGAAPPESNLDNLLWGQIGDVVDTHGSLFDGDRNTFRRLERSKLEYVTGQAIPQEGGREKRLAAWSGKHAPYLLFILDEGDGIPDEIYEAIDTCMSGGILTRLLVLFNPRHASGILYEMERDNGAHVVEVSAFSHPNVTTGETIIPGAVDRESVVRKVNEWTRPALRHERRNPAMADKVFHLPVFLAGETAQRPGGGVYPPLTEGFRVIENPTFSYSVLARYPAMAENALIDRTWIEAARARYDDYVATHGEPTVEAIERLSRSAPVLMGVDASEGEEGGDESVVVYRIGGLVSPFDARGGTDVLKTAAWALRKAEAAAVSTVFVDAIGIGQGVGIGMIDGVTYRLYGEEEPVYVEGLGEERVVLVKTSETADREVAEGRFWRKRDELLWMVRLWLKGDLPGYEPAMLPPDRALLDDLAAPIWWTDPAGYVRVSDKKMLRARLRRSTDRLDALKMTFALATYASMVSPVGASATITF